MAKNRNLNAANANFFCNSSGSGTPQIPRAPNILRKFFLTSIIIPTWPATRPLAGCGKEILSIKPAMVSRNPALFTEITEPSIVEILFPLTYFNSSRIHL